MQPALAERIVAEVVGAFPRRAARRAAACQPVARGRQAGEAALQALAGLDAQAGADADLRLVAGREYDALGDLAAAAERALAAGPQDDQTFALRASLLARAEDKDALTELYDELRAMPRDPTRSAACCWGRWPNSSSCTRRRWTGTAACPAARSAGSRSCAPPTCCTRWAARPRPTTRCAACRPMPKPPEEARRDAYLLEAELRDKDKDAAGELDAFARGLAAFPDEPELLYARALTWERRDDIARAEADFRRILVAEPDNVAALNALGYTLADRTTATRRRWS